MKIEVKKMEQDKQKLSIEVGADAVNKKFDDVYSRIGKEAEVPGFRKGKAPRDILEKHYKDLARQEVIKELVPESYNQAIEKESLAVLNCEQVTDVKLDDGILTFSAMIEMKPEIKFKKSYNGINLTYKEIEATDAEVKGKLDALKESKKVKEIDDEFARGLGYPRKSDLDQAVKRQICLEKDNNQRAKTEDDLVNHLISSTDFKIPLSLVKQQAAELLERQKIDLIMRGMPKEKIEEQEPKMRQALEPQAEKQVRVYLILEEIAKKENIEVDKNLPQKVMEFLFKNANWKVS